MTGVAGFRSALFDARGKRSFEEIQFSHAFQPIVDIRSRKVVSYEVLLRGIDNEPPGHVFNQVAQNRPQFDQSSQDELMLFDQLNRERALCLAAKLGIDCSINLNFLPSSILFEDGRLLRETLIAANNVCLDARQIVVEVTEGELVHDIEPLRLILNELRREKVTIAIDDFGAGFSGLNMLANIHPDWIKVDMLLVRDIQDNGARQSILRAVCSVCQDLGIRVIAEGVETQQEYEFLRRIGITWYQGFLFGKPGFECLPTVTFPE